MNRRWFSRLKKKYILCALILLGIIYYITVTVPFGSYVYIPEKPEVGIPAGNLSKLPLDPQSPWPKFRGNAMQNGRSAVIPEVDSRRRPWSFRSAMGVFSSPVVDGSGNVYIGSADRNFYAIDDKGRLIWKFPTEEIIDSSALLDDRGRVYFGSGDGHVYCLDRATGSLIWKFQAHSVEEVKREFAIETHNLAWFEGNIGILPDGTIIAPNDNYLVYGINREDGARKMVYPGNEMIWSLPAINVNTHRLFFGSCYTAVKNIYCYDSRTGRQEWTTGGTGSVAASTLLTSNAENGVVVVGGFDGYVRAYAQDSGKQLWKRGVRGHIYSSPAQLSNGTIIQPAADGTVYALNPVDGTILWSFDTLEPIRSSPAIDANDLIYFGSGEGRLFCINRDGTLRWAYRCIDEDRNDLNASPALGKTGVYAAGENGGIFYVPYDYPLSYAGKQDPRCSLGPGEDLPADGIHLVFTTRFGKLQLDTPRTIDANQPLVFSLLVRKNGDTVPAALDRDSLHIEVSGDRSPRIDVAADRQFVMLTPQETWTTPSGGTLQVSLNGKYLTDMSRVGLLFFGGSVGGSFERKFTFTVPARKEGNIPYRVPGWNGQESAIFELCRIAAPNPTILPSWNQIGFDSLRYLAGAVEGNDRRVLLWVIGGKSTNGKTVADPALEVRYPLILEYDQGLVTLHNYQGFKTNFIGSWDMPFGFYRLATRVDPKTGAVKKPPAFSAVALCDDIDFYGPFLKLTGMSEFKTGHMPVFGALNLNLHGNGYTSKPEFTGQVSFSADATKATARIRGAKLKPKDRVLSLLVVHAATGRPFPLYYTKKTTVKIDAGGNVEEVSVSYAKRQVRGKIRLYLLVDTFPVAKDELSVGVDQPTDGTWLTMPPESTTATTDAMLALCAIFVLVKIRALKSAPPAKISLWSWFLFLLALASGYGAFLHGIVLGDELLGKLWVGLFFILGMMISVLFVAILYEWKGSIIIKPALAIMLPLGGLCFLAILGLSYFLKNSFIGFIAYSSVLLVLALVILSALTVFRRDMSLAAMATGVALIIAGSCIQALGSHHFTVIWEFDHNSIYHLLAIAAVYFFYRSLNRNIT